ncbi:acyl-CoA thioesterase [candidate division TA06 bacterium]|nr:acyl-CoA thioesterase [candidate division TA06 bacterium]
MITNEIKIRVSYADTDKMGVTYHSRYLEYFERGRTELLRELGLPYAEMERDGISLPVIEAHCNYLKGAQYDELITVKSLLKEKPTVRIKIEYEVLDDSKKELIATGYTIHSFVNSNGKPTRPPKEFLKLISELT